MRELIIIIVLLGFGTQLNAQLIHELKTPVFRSFKKDYLPSYELITKNKRFGFEIGAGYNFRNTTLRDTADFVLGAESYLQFDEFDKTLFQSFFDWKIYFDKQFKGKPFELFFGPHFQFNKVTFLEDSFLIRQAELTEKFGHIIGELPDQRTILTGLTTGIKILIKSKWVIEWTLKRGVFFEDNVDGKLQFKKANLDRHMYVKFGYRFNQKAKEKIPE